MGEMDSAIGQGPFGVGREYLQPLLGRKPIDEQRWKESSDYRPGLSYFDGMTEEAAKLLAERHDERAGRQDILNRDPGGYIRTPLLYATQFAAGMADPVGVAASFIPVVGQARYARMLAQIGAPLARLATGAVEGAVGQALLEPLVYAAAQKDQLDYSMADSLINVAMGAGQGAALHAGAGWIADLWRGHGGRVTAAAGDVAIRQAAAGREVDVRPVVRAGIEEARRAESPGPFGEGVPRAADVLAQRQGQRVAVEPAAARGEIQLEQRRSAERGAIAADRETLRKGRAEDAAKPQTPPEQRKQAMADLVEAYPSREITLPSGGKVTRKGPMDIVTYLRAIGGVRDDGGELRAIDAASYNKSREVAFAKGEQFLGRLVHENGIPLEEAARRAAQDGFIGRTEMQTNEYGETGAFTAGTTEELVAAIEQTLHAGESMEGRVWGVDDDGPVREFIQTMRTIDENEMFAPEPHREVWQPLTDDEDELAGFDPRDLEGIDNENLADELWKEEMEREAAGKARAPEDPQVEATPRPEGEPAPLTAEQEVELDAERRRSGIAAAAACVAKALS
jgi:hypothetical protein